MAIKLCIFDGCTNSNFARGYCSGHNKQIQQGRTLAPLRGRRPPNTESSAWCCTCKQYLSFSDFSWDTTRNDYNRVCKSCRNLKQRVNGKTRNTSLAYYHANKTKILAQKYGLTEELYEQVFEAQDHKCAICGRHNDEFVKRLAVDHDHKTGAIRGLLCMYCNTALGKFNDSIELLEAAINYLRSGGPLADLALTVDETLELI